MGSINPVDQSEEFARLAAEVAGDSDRYVLKLYVTGSTPRSTKAIRDIRAFCESNLEGRYELEVIDIHQQPLLARTEQIIAAPTLVKQEPAPTRKLIGDLSNNDRIRASLSLPPSFPGGAVA